MSGVDTRQKHGLMDPWLPGQSGNPKGRPKGARCRLSEAFLDDLLVSWEREGPSVIRRVMETKPDVYLKVVASLLPRDINIASPAEGMSDAELVDRIRRLDGVLQPFIESIVGDDDLN